MTGQLITVDGGFLLGRPNRPANVDAIFSPDAIALALGDERLICPAAAASCETVERASPVTLILRGTLVWLSRTLVCALA